MSSYDCLLCLLIEPEPQPRQASKTSSVDPSVSRDAIESKTSYQGNG